MFLLVKNSPESAFPSRELFFDNVLGFVPSPIQNQNGSVCSLSPLQFLRVARKAVQFFT